MIARRPANPLCVALDRGDRAALAALAAAVGAEAGMLKVGLEAFAAHGPAAVAEVGAHGPVFLDLKLHDIPNTVAGAAAAVAGLGAELVTVHAAGGAAMIEAAVDAAAPTGVLAVTVLTSLDDEALRELGSPPASEQVPRLARLAVAAGAAGVVCAPAEVAAVREAVGPEALLVTPGIRPTGAAADDQARVATPAAARAAGADVLVVGRPVTAAADPAGAARALLAELAAEAPR